MSNMGDVMKVLMIVISLATQDVQTMVTTQERCEYNQVIADFDTEVECVSLHEIS